MRPRSEVTRVVTLRFFLTDAPPGREVARVLCYAGLASSANLH